MRTIANLIYAAHEGNISLIKYKLQKNILFFILNISLTTVVPCSTFTTLGYTWPQGQDGKVNFIVPVSATTWTVVMSFDSTITTFNAWNGVLVNCVGGTVCTFTNQVKWLWIIYISHFEVCMLLWLKILEKTISIIICTFECGLSISTWKYFNPLHVKKLSEKVVVVSKVTLTISVVKFARMFKLN